MLDFFIFSKEILKMYFLILELEKLIEPGYDIVLCIQFIPPPLSNLHVSDTPNSILLLLEITF